MTSLSFVKARVVVPCFEKITLCSNFMKLMDTSPLSTKIEVLIYKLNIIFYETVKLKYSSLD
jgi:hypothetical protein